MDSMKNSLDPFNQNPDFCVFPNPSAGDFNVQFTGGINRNVRIHNLLGESVVEKFSVDENLKFSLPEKGIYFLRIDLDGISKAELIVVN